jgi:hypothetical protein
MRRYAARRDDNHEAIVKALRGIGVGLLDTGSAGDGMTDLVTFWRGIVRLVEIKDGSKEPARRRLTPAQEMTRSLARAHGCDIHVVESVDQALALHGAKT